MQQVGPGFLLRHLNPSECGSETSAELQKRSRARKEVSLPSILAVGEPKSNRGTGESRRFTCVWTLDASTESQTPLDLLLDREEKMS